VRAYVRIGYNNGPTENVGEESEGPCRLHSAVDNEGPRKNDIIVINIIYLLEETLEKNSIGDNEQDGKAQNALTTAPIKKPKTAIMQNS